MTKVVECCTICLSVVIVDAAMARRECEYEDCDFDAEIEIELCGEIVHVCEDCDSRIEDQSGYCSISCQLGYGCDDSC